MKEISASLEMCINIDFIGYMGDKVCNEKKNMKPIFQKFLQIAISSAYRMPQSVQGIEGREK